ncbi:DEAD/DEAH box helicase family protein, partial [Cellulomonas sp. P5_C6]
MALSDLHLETNYESGRNVLLDEFYIPCLQEANSYDRAAGYFSSTLYHVVAIAFTDFVRRGGRMRLICSPELSPADFQAMKAGAEAAQLAQNAVREDLLSLLENPTVVPATKLLATLIANEIVDVRIAFADEPDGLFHAKVGVFKDPHDNRVSFNGSVNETWRGWGKNHETFDAFRSWESEHEYYRTVTHEDLFQQAWLGRNPLTRIARLEDVTLEHLRSIAADKVDAAIDDVRSYGSRVLGQKKSRTLLDHQLQVLEDWAAKGNRGIVNFATGAGKTLTAIEAVKRWSGVGGSAIILVPGKDLHSQWIREIESELPDAQILPAGAGHSKSDWVNLLPVFTAPATSALAARIVVATNRTFASPEFQRRIKSGKHLLVVADEMHRAGTAPILEGLENTEVGATLGLSATFRRQFDELGTARLEAFFGPVLSPVIGLAEAVLMGLLVPYDYRLHEVSLDDVEHEEYERISKRIRQMVAMGSSLQDESGGLRRLLIQRARVLKNAREKVPRALSILLEEYRAGDRWLVYCDNLTQLRNLSAACLSAGLPVLEFYAGMPSDRGAVIKSLGSHGGIVVAIRCLDEGIDIPVTDHALILASSTVEREYIQRRGRVLRRSPSTGKVSAEVHDLILVDENSGALTRGEASRALEFARLAR